MTVPRTGAGDLAAADEGILDAISTMHSDPARAQVLALVAIGRALTAIARRHDEACREIADVLSAARRDDAP